MKKIFTFLPLLIIVLTMIGCKPKLENTTQNGFITHIETVKVGDHKELPTGHYYSFKYEYDKTILLYTDTVLVAGLYDILIGERFEIETPPISPINNKPYYKIIYNIKKCEKK